jgi:hypothetical protein
MAHVFSPFCRRTKLIVDLESSSSLDRIIDDVNTSTGPGRLGALVRATTPIAAQPNLWF